MCVWLCLQFRFQDPSLLRMVHQLRSGPPPGLTTSSWQQQPSLLFLNKQDKLEHLVRSTVLQQLRQQLCGAMDFVRVFEGAAMLGQGVSELKDYLAKQVCACAS